MCQCDECTGGVAELDFEARYRVSGYGGVAFYLLGYASEWTEEWVEDVGTQTMPDFILHEAEELENRSMVRAVMVGDDREHLIDVDELEPLDEDDYCHECGQIGCTADGRGDGWTL